MKEAIKQVGLFAAKATFVFALVIGSLLVFGGVLYKTVTDIDDDIGYPRTYSAEGSAEKKVKLDTAQVTLGVILKDSTPALVQKEAGERYEKAINAIKQLGIPEEDIQTQNYNVSTVYNPDTRAVEGYEINLSLQVTVRDTSPEAEMISNVINKASENGFNSVQNLYFYLEDLQSVQDELKNEAIEDAKQRAKNEADAAGLKLGDVINMYSYTPGPYYDREYGATAMEANVVKESTDSSLPSIQIQPGQTEVSIEVTLEYEIL